MKNSPERMTMVPTKPVRMEVLILPKPPLVGSLLPSPSPNSLPSPVRTNVGMSVGSSVDGINVGSLVSSSVETHPRSGSKQVPEGHWQMLASSLSSGGQSEQMECVREHNIYAHRCSAENR